MKTILRCVLGIFLALLLLLGIGVGLLRNALNDSLSKKEILALVEENSALVLQDIEKNEFSETLLIEGIKEISPVEDVIDFYCGGAGMGPATSYYGFYYTAEDVPAAIFCGTSLGSKELLAQDGKGFSVSAEGDDHYYTEKILDHFYYYEAHF